MRKNVKAITAFMTGAMIFSAVPFSVSAENGIPDTGFYEEEIIEEEPESGTMFYEKNGKYYLAEEKSGKYAGLTDIPDKYGQLHPYYFRSDGSLVTGFFKTPDGKIMYAEPDISSPKFGQIYIYERAAINGKDYAFGADGGMITGWLANRYYRKSGAMLKDRRVRIGGTAYVFDENGNSVPYKLACAAPSELKFPEIHKNADTELIDSGIGNVTSENELLDIYRGKYIGKVLYNGDEYEMSAVFGMNKKIQFVTLTADGDVTGEFNDLFADEYEKRHDPKYAGDWTYFERYFDDYYEYAFTRYRDGKTEIQYGWEGYIY